MQFFIFLCLIGLIIIAFISYLFLLSSVHILLKMIYLTKGLALLMACGLGILLLVIIGYAIHWMINGICCLKEIKFKFKS